MSRTDILGVRGKLIKDIQGIKRVKFNFNISYKEQQKLNNTLERKRAEYNFLEYLLKKEGI